MMTNEANKVDGFTKTSEFRQRWSTNRLNIFAEANWRRWCHRSKKGSEYIEEGEAWKTNWGGKRAKKRKEVD